MDLFRSLALLALLVPLAAAAADATTAEAKPTPPQARMTAAECEVWARELSFAKSVADHDAVAFAEHIDPGAAFAAESPEPLRGRSAITQQWDGIIQGKRVLLSWYPTRTTIAGAPDVAISSGPALFEDPHPGANPRYRLGAFHSVWHRSTDGAWRVLFDDGQAPTPVTDAQVEAFRTGRQERCPQG
jgi:ketosteroid isomerase-like protein